MQRRLAPSTRQSATLDALATHATRGFRRETAQRAPREAPSTTHEVSGTTQHTPCSTARHRARGARQSATHEAHGFRRDTQRRLATSTRQSATQGFRRDIFNPDQSKAILAARSTPAPRSQRQRVSKTPSSTRTRGLSRPSTHLGTVMAPRPVPEIVDTEPQFPRVFTSARANRIELVPKQGDTELGVVPPEHPVHT